MSKHIHIGMPDKNVLLSGSIIIFLGQVCSISGQKESTNDFTMEYFPGGLSFRWEK